MEDPVLMVSRTGYEKNIWTCDRGIKRAEETT
jgi:hypothetical protein